MPALVWVMDCSAIFLPCKRNRCPFEEESSQGWEDFTESRIPFPLESGSKRRSGIKETRHLSHLSQTVKLDRAILVTRSHPIEAGCVLMGLARIWKCHMVTQQAILIFQLTLTSYLTLQVDNKKYRAQV